MDSNHIIVTNVGNVNILPEKPAETASGRTYHHGNLRATLVEEGLAVLRESGLSGLSVRDLARRAKVSPNAAYRHFADKSALLGALAAEGFRKLDAAANGAGQGIVANDPGESLQSFGAAYIRAARDNPGLFRLMFDGSHFPNRNDELIAAGQTTFERLRSAVALARGLPIEDDRVKTGALFAWSLVHGLSHLILDDQIEGDIDAEVASVLALAARPLGDNKRS